MKRILNALLWEPGAMIAAAGWRYQQHRRHRAWCEGYRAGFAAGLTTANRTELQP